MGILEHPLLVAILFLTTGICIGTCGTLWYLMHTNQIKSDDQENKCTQ